MPFRSEKNEGLGKSAEAMKLAQTRVIAAIMRGNVTLCDDFPSREITGLADLRAEKGGICAAYRAEGNCGGASRLNAGSQLSAVVRLDLQQARKNPIRINDSDENDGENIKVEF